MHVPEVQMETDRPPQRLPHRQQGRCNELFFKTIYRTWSDLPRELRDLIYGYCLLYEGIQVHNVRHFPHGFRRSGRNDGAGANFSKSFWSFTQANRQVRAEFTPCLRKLRRVSTPLATLNAYVGIFNPVDKQTGARTGWIEPIEPNVSGLSLSPDGVEVLSLIEHNRFDPDFHLELHPEPTDIGPHDFDELDVLYRLDCNINPRGTLFKACGITSITLFPVSSPFCKHNSMVVHSSVQAGLKQKFMIKLDVKPTSTVDGIIRTTLQQRCCLEYWIYEEALLTSYWNLHIQAGLSRYEATWIIITRTLLVRKWEEYNGNEDQLRNTYFLWRNASISESGHQLITINELLKD
ncbi:hypothetical protein ST47_g289 [Ascochyta rabiei]|uniref:Uncharacterized protein n=1 Tax=Didymella rabiei TaxID=5454 RepID=A0A163MBU7_DIDRA|nr:hypothetical protein ST47_g9976 [Ascochyta rabiei]KZM28574.1 hypothetical protein ST47_g289 [Ascochyta rabiei]